MELQGFAYRMVNTGHGSHRFGNCEICGKHVDTIYHLTQTQRYEYDGKTGMTHHNCFSAWGHKDCLAKLTNERVA